MARNRLLFYGERCRPMGSENIQNANGKHTRTDYQLQRAVLIRWWKINFS